MQQKLELFGNNSIRIAVVGVLAILALFLFAETISTVGAFSNPTTPPANTITVNGTGQAALAPDIAHITFTVQNTAATVSAAQDATTKQANAAIAYVAGQGIADKDVTTLSYNIYPQYASTVCAPGTFCPAQSNTVSGYQVSESIQVTVRDLTKVSDLLAGLGSQNVQNISGPDFALENPSAGNDAARAQAIADAKTQAVTLADQLGVHLGRIVSFSDGSGGYPSPVMYAKSAGATMSMDAAAAPSVPAGENTYTDTVSITYAIR